MPKFNSRPDSDYATPLCSFCDSAKGVRPHSEFGHLCLECAALPVPSASDCSLADPPLSYAN